MSSLPVPPPPAGPTDGATTPVAVPGPLGPAVANALLAQSPLSIALYDAAGRVAFGNTAYERHFGIRLADVPPDYSLLGDPQLEAAGLAPLIRRAYAGESVVLPPVRYDAARATDGAGRTIWTQGHCFPVRDEAGAVAHVAIVHVDVTPWAAAEAALRETTAALELRNAHLRDQARELDVERARLARVIAQLPAAVAVFEGPELRFRALSAAYQQIVGGREVLGRPLREALPELANRDAGADFVGLLERVYGTGEAVVLTNQRARWDASGTGEATDHLIDLIYAPLRAPAHDGDARGAVEGVTALVLDVSARVRAEDAVRESESRLRLALRSGGLGWWEWDAATNVVRWSPEVEAMHGMVPGSFAGTFASFRETIHPDDEPRVLAEIARTVSTRAQRYTVRYRYLRREPDGRTIVRWLEGEARLYLDAAGEPLRLLGVVGDATERVELLAATEAARRDAESAKARLTDVFRQAPAFIAVLRGPDHVFELVNDQYYQLAGHRETVGKTVLEALPEVRGQGFTELLDGVLATGEPFVGRELPIRLAREPGAPLEERYVTFVYQPLTEPDGTRSGIFLHGVDVTDEVRTRREVEAARRDAEAARRAAEEANAAKGQFLATMSHELRTPLNAIGGYAQLIEMGVRGPVTPAQLADLARIQHSQQHLLGLINSVLNYAKLEAGRVAYDLADVPLGAAVAAVEALVAPQMRAEGVEYEFPSCDPALAARADAEKLRQIVLNLLSNAIKFTPAGGRISVLCEAAGPTTVMVRVSDTGIGIAASQLGSIFDPFIQVDRRLTSPVEGVGLGLAISRDLARGMGGDLTAESALGVGSTFTLTLPRAVAQP